MEIRFLTDFDLTELHETFLRAFSDYLVPMNLSRRQFQELLKRRGARNDISVAAFEKDLPIGFTLNAFELYQAIPTVYDVVTGTIPEARGKGVARRIFDFSLPKFREIGATRYVLEVFEKNLPAVHLYEKVGFSVTRKLEVFIHSNMGIGKSASASSLYTVREVEPSWEIFQTFWDWHPSWQNSVSSIQRSETQKNVSGIFKDSQLIGYGVMFPETGDIPQFAIHRDHRRKKAGSTLFQNLQSLMQPGKALRVVNVDGSARETILFLKNIGFDLFGIQNEMEMIL